MTGIYVPEKAVVADTKELGGDSTLLTIRLADRKKQAKFTWIPGQFIEVGLMGYGEIPVGIASSPLNKKSFQVSVRGVGGVSDAVRRLEKGDAIHVRGPFGNGFPVKEMTGKNVMVIGGGCGIPPLRSLLEYAMANKQKFKSITLLYGSRTKKDLLFSMDYERWVKAGVNVKLTVDKRDESWGSRLPVKCNVGVVTKLLDNIKVERNTVAALCGPPVMYKFVSKRLLELGVKPKDILLSLERRMKCGVGKCQHCTVNKRYVCVDGPVFTYEELMKG
ncbi:MAG: FAD/NAD(P)-binding protein, partial [Candidatus Altiarchaeota archaeon]|nr:FAD/NAD(P)-binding protein [Candidatus Altiarchaeota archaeon]